MPIQSISPSASWRNLLEDARLGEQDGVERQAQFLGDLRRRNPVEGHAAEGGQRGRLEHRLDQLHQPAQDVAVVFLVPLASKFALGIGELRQRALLSGAANVCGRFCRERW